jgi:hypothetical protein
MDRGQEEEEGTDVILPPGAIIVGWSRWEPPFSHGS